jgi:phosphatidylinositol alpha-1,6-mannosyltransferase
MGNGPRICYASPGLFDMGGIARYGRYQLRALRELVGDDRVFGVSMLAPDGRGFESECRVDRIAGGTTLRNKAAFVSTLLGRMSSTDIWWSGHLNYAPLMAGLALMRRKPAVVNIYGHEVWTNRGRLKDLALPRCWVVADCHSTLGIAESEGIVDTSRAAVIHDPVDLAQFYPDGPDEVVASRYGLRMDGRFRVMFLGRLGHGAEHKNPDVLIRCFAAARLPADAELVIVGSGDGKAKLEALASSLGLGERARFLGRVPDADLAGVYRLASLFVLVSRRYEGGGEGIPLTPLEAAACGVPIVVGDDDGSREACEHGKSGLILPARDEDALVRALEDMADNPQRRLAMGHAAAVFARANFSFERFVSQHRDLLSRIRDSE